MLPDFIQDLKNRLQQPLPGTVSQLKMANAFREISPAQPDNVRKAAVLLLIYQKEEKWYFPLIQRPSNNPNDRHSGQMSFPGGSVETIDVNLQMTALREAEEEIGVIVEDISILGNLSQLYVSVSNFMVYPFIGYLPYVPKFQAQESEVAEILEIEISDLQNRANLKKKDMHLKQGFHLKDVPYFDIQEKTIWGATAMILSEWLEILQRK